MTRRSVSAYSLMLHVTGSAQALAQLAPEMIERSKRATALVEVAHAKGSATGTAFCVDESGLYITNAHVIRGAVNEEGAMRLILGIGSKNQRSVPARVIRHDDRLDLALLAHVWGGST
jgi:S1-C subfamily serine protease